METTRWRTNVILVAMLIGLTIVAHKVTQDEVLIDNVESVSILKPQSTTSIRIHKKGKYTHIEKQAGIWNITSPIYVKANQFRINSLLKLLATKKYKKLLINKVGLDDYGLDEPLLSVQFNDVTVDFGTTNPVSAMRYILIDSIVFLTDDAYFPFVNSQIGTLADPSLLPDFGELSKLQSNNFTFSRDSKGIWQNNKSITSDKVTETIEHWKNTQAFGIHDYMKRDVIDKIDVHFEHDSNPITFLVTSINPWLIIARPDIKLEYHLAKNMPARYCCYRPEKIRGGIWNIIRITLHLQSRSNHARTSRS